jgi:uncharacterized Zn finger protein
MSEIVHLKCDGCGLEVVHDILAPKTDWAHVRVNRRVLDYCPECWPQFISFAPWTGTSPPWKPANGEP